ncbi:MAG: hypothetical protein EXR69_11470, partial [Myxococcales bacterium]|nr:hypothetical protein [Myxococcales bacterium]
MPFDIDRLARALPGTPRAQLQKWVDTWEARGEDEPNDFVSWLHHHEDIPDRALRDVATGTPVLLDSRVVGHALRVLGEIGRGAMGEVMLARDEGLHRTVVVKRLHARLAT